MLFVNPQQVLPLAKLALKTEALRDLESRDDAALDLLASLAGELASAPVVFARSINVSCESDAP
jgi:hypothetical protein